MAFYLNSDDLIRFLHGRKSTDCQLAADWVEDHPGDPLVLCEVDRLEGYLFNVARLMFEDEGISTQTWSRARLLAGSCYRLPALHVLRPEFDPAVYLDQPDRNEEEWLALVELARVRIARRGAAWAAVIGRQLRLASAPG